MTFDSENSQSRSAYDYDEVYFDAYSSERKYEERQESLRQRYEATGDTVYNMRFIDYIKKILSLGFELVLRDPIDRLDHGRVMKESFYVFARRDGLLLTMETYTHHFPGYTPCTSETHTNHVKLYYNWIPKYAYSDDVMSSGSFVFETSTDMARGKRIEPHTWAGNNDVREGLAYTIEVLRDDGELMKTWVQSPLDYLAGYASVPNEIRAGQGKSNVVGEMLAERSMKNFDALPDWVKEMIGKENPLGA